MTQYSSSVPEYLGAYYVVSFLPSLSDKPGSYLYRNLPSPLDASKFKSYIQRPNVFWRRSNFDLRFRTRHINKADKLDIREGHRMVFLPHLVPGSTCDPYRPAASGSRYGNSGCTIHWSEAVQYLLQKYSIKAAIGDDIDDLLAVLQSDIETKTCYYALLNNNASRLGNAHDEHEKITLYLKNLFPGPSTIILCFRNVTLRC